MKIKTLAQLAKAAEGKRAVHCPKGCWTTRHMPAVWMMNLSGSVLHRLFRQGIFTYTKKTKPKTP